MKMKILSAMVKVAIAAMAVPAMADQGPSTGTAPYILPIAKNVGLTSFLTTGDAIGGYTFSGIPDGLGAYDNEDGTFTLLVNHEIPVEGSTGPGGIVRSHGGKGAFVSEWVIDKKTLAVISGDDLMKKVYQLGSAGWELIPASGTLGSTNAFARFCSADLADHKAFFNGATRKGTKARIFLNGEESNPVYKRGFAHVATGRDKGSSFVLPWASTVNAGWENFLANPYAGDKTVIIGNSDGGFNGVYVYVGDKTNVGNDIEKAGLIGGKLFRIALSDASGSYLNETLADAVTGVSAPAGLGLGSTPNARGNYEGSFTLVDVAAVGDKGTNFLRPEDGAWDKKNHNRYFFNTTSQMDKAKDGLTGQIGRTRLWALTFKDSSKPALGGSIELLLDGTSAKGDYQMFDNMTVNEDGTLILQEDPGNDAHNAKIWKFNPSTGTLVKLAGFDPVLFGDIDPITHTVTTGTITKDEETSGIIDVTELLDREDDNTYSLFTVQNHKVSNDPVTVEGGQLLLMSQPAPKHDDGDGHDDGDHK